MENMNAVGRLCKIFCCHYNVLFDRCASLSDINISHVPVICNVLQRVCNLTNWIEFPKDLVVDAMGIEYRTLITNVVKLFHLGFKKHFYVVHAVF